MTLVRIPLDERLWSRLVESESGCWLYTAGLTSTGYVRISSGGGDRPRHINAHKYMYEKFIATVPPELQLDHLCRVRNCVNPWHLEPVTPRVNTLRSGAITALQAAQTHCKRGHEFTLENTRRYRGRRVCRRCRAAAERARKAGTCL